MPPRIHAFFSRILRSILNLLDYLLAGQSCLDCCSQGRVNPPGIEGLRFWPRRLLAPYSTIMEWATKGVSDGNNVAAIEGCMCSVGAEQTIIHQRRAEDILKLASSSVSRGVGVKTRDMAF